MGALQDGQPVAIIGGGPTGAACAIALNDLFYGHVMRKLAITNASYGFLDSVMDLARGEPLLRRARFNCVSAHQPCRDKAIP